MEKTNGSSTSSLPENPKPWQSYHTIFTDAKAGMEGVEEEKVQRIVYERAKDPSIFRMKRAEDMMGSLLREHVSVPQRQDEHAADMSNKDSTALEEKDSSTDNIQDAKEASNHNLEKGSLDERANGTSDKEITTCKEKDSSMDNAQDSKEGSNHDSENGMVAPEYSESSEKELERLASQRMENLLHSSSKMWLPLLILHAEDFIQL